MPFISLLLEKNNDGSNALSIPVNSRSLSYASYFFKEILFSLFPFFSPSSPGYYRAANSLSQISSDQIVSL